MFNFPVLIGDIGGTNARFSIVLDAHSSVIDFAPTRLAEHFSLEEAIKTSVLDKTKHRPRTMVLAIAAPLTNSDRFPLTNADKVIDAHVMMDCFCLDALLVMNDFAAQGLAAVALSPEHLLTIGGDKAALKGDEHAPKVILGPGTGLGIANVIRARDSWIILPGEGGHIDLGPRSRRETAIWEELETIGGRISAEQVICGRGLRNLYQAIARVEGADAVQSPMESDITRSALERSDPVAVEACEIFVTALGRVAGDLALLTLARGGVYVTGGIAQKLIPMFQTDAFRRAMDDKAPHQNIMKQIPASLITHKTAALCGLASFAQKPELYVMEQAIREFKKP